MYVYCFALSVAKVLCLQGELTKAHQRVSWKFYVLLSGWSKKIVYYSRHHTLGLGIFFIMQLQTILYYRVYKIIHYFTFKTTSLQ